jgi:hypothetical protein
MTMRIIFVIAMLWMLTAAGLIVAGLVYGFMYGKEDWMPAKMILAGVGMYMFAPLWKLVLFGPLERR